MSLHKEISFETEVCAYLGTHGWLHAEETLVARLRDQLDRRGTLDVPRHGVQLLGLKQALKLAEFKPRPVPWSHRR